MMARSTRSMSILFVLAMLIALLVAFAPMRPVYAEDDFQAPVVNISAETVDDGGATSASAIVTVTVADMGGSGIITVSGVESFTVTSNTADYKEYTNTFTNDGSYSISVTAVDGKGNTGSGTFSFTIDKTKPDVAISLPKNEGRLSWYKTWPTITITAYTDGTNDIVDTNAVISYAYNQTDNPGTVTGSYTHPFVIEKDGTFALSASATDAAGNIEIVENGVTYKVDTTFPVATMSVLPSITKNSTLTVRGMYVEANLSNIKIGLNGVESRSIGTDNPFSLPINLKEGTNEIYARIADEAGNVAFTPIQTVVLDTIAPTGDVNYSTDNPTNESVTATLNTSDANTVKITSESNTDDPAVYTFASNESFTFNFVDAAGNPGSAIAKVDWIDTETPFAPTISTEQQTLNSDSIAIEGMAEAGSTITIGGGMEVSTGRADGGTFSIIVAIKQDAVNTLSITATDSAGNVSEPATVAITEDSTAPDIIMNGIASTKVEALSNYIDRGATATDAVDGAVAVTSESSVDTSVLGTYTVTYRAVDSSGNLATARRSVEVVDTIAPIITLVGANSVTVELGADYTESGSSATDAVNGAVVVTSESSVDTSATGTYTVTYSAIDASGNRATANRTVIVVDTVAPIGSISYSTTQTTNQTVTATLTTKDTNTVIITSISNTDNPAAYTFTSNGSFTFRFIDAAGNEGNVVAEVSCIDKKAPESPLISTDPENGISRNSVEILLSQERDTDIAYIDYRILTSSESAWIPYDKPFEISEKGTWILEARAWDKAGNKSESSIRELILKNARRREIEPSSQAVSRMDINLAYVLPSGTILDIERIVTPYDEFGNIIANKSFTFESSDSNVLEILSDGSIISKNPGSVYLTSTDIGTGETYAIPIVIEAAAGNGNIFMTDIENHWAKDAIDEFCKEGFIRGDKDGTFRPENEITIEECIAVLERIRLCGFELDYAPRKSDIPKISAGDWSLCYDLSSLSRMDVDILRDAFGDDLLLSRPITRGEAALLFDQSEDWDNPDQCAECPLMDVKNNRFIESINKAYTRGLVTGYPDGSFRPEASITRAEMTTLFSRFIDSL